jgi:hypothetical protein
MEERSPGLLACSRCGRRRRLAKYAGSRSRSGVCHPAIAEDKFEGIYVLDSGKSSTPSNYTPLLIVECPRSATGRTRNPFEVYTVGETIKETWREISSTSFRNSYII